MKRYLNVVTKNEWFFEKIQQILANIKNLKLAFEKPLKIPTVSASSLTFKSLRW
ncbi:hypothetical protein PGB90_003891 [Kerria lacca]